MKNVVIIIPAYNPDNELVKLVNQLTYYGYKDIIVINDGSNKKTEKYFKKIENEVHIVEHKENKGKGIAIKSGLQEYLKRYIKKNNYKGVICVDADGQHTLRSINKIYDKLISKEKVIIGSRNLQEKGIPIASKIGNRLINKIFKIMYNSEIKDTQTGLRGIPNKYIKEFIKIKGDRYEYETNQIIYIILNKIPYYEEKIETIYINKNKNSKFKKIRDGIKIILALFN